MPAEFDISPVIPAQPQPSPTPAPQTPPVSVPPSPTAPAPLMSKSGSNRLLKWLILGAVGLFVVTVASLFWGGSSFSTRSVSLTLEGPDKATSGDEVMYTVTYKNDTKVALTDMSFRLFYPSDSIVLKDGKPTTPESEAFTVDRLDPGQSEKKEFKIYIVGDKGAIKQARVHVLFQAGSLRSSFEKEATLSTTITALPITLTLVAPPTTVSGQSIQYILDMRNESGVDASDLKATFKYPDGFTPSAMQPQPTEGNSVWSVEQLAAGQGKRITVTGTLNGNQQETKTVAVTLQRNIDGQYVDYVRTDAFTMISSPLLSVTLTPNEGRDYVAFVGDTLRYTVGYANNSQFTLIGLSLKVKLDGDMYDLSQLRVDQGFFDQGTRTVTFDSSGVSAFSGLRPGQRGTVTFSVPVKTASSGVGANQNLFVKATARLATSNVPSGIDGSEVFATDSLVTKISSQPSLVQALLYDNGAGSGPLPPQVGQATTVTVQWSLTNPGNDIKNAKVVATLPPGVTFKSAGTTTLGSAPAYNSATNQVTWSIGTLPFGAGNGSTRPQAQFQISFTPSSNQQGQSVLLVSGATLSGTDAFTNQAIQVKLRDYTTDSIDGHTDDGRVQ